MLKNYKEEKNESLYKFGQNYQKKCHKQINQPNKIPYLSQEKIQQVQKQKPFLVKQKIKIPKAKSQKPKTPIIQMNETEILCVLLAIVAGLTGIFVLFSIAWLSNNKITRWKDIDLSVLFLSMLFLVILCTSEYITKSLGKYDSSRYTNDILFIDVENVIYSIMYYIILMRLSRGYAEVLHFSQRKIYIYNVLLVALIVFEVSSKIFVYTYFTESNGFLIYTRTNFGVLMNILQIIMMIGTLFTISYYYMKVNSKCFFCQEKMFSTVCFSSLIGNTLYIVTEILCLEWEESHLSFFTEFVVGMAVCCCNFLPILLINIWVLKQLSLENKLMEQYQSELEQLEDT